MKETLRDLKERRSCRAYLPEQIREEALAAILEAGTYAPTGMGRQSPVIVAVQDPETRNALSRMNAAVMGRDGDPFYGAPTVVVVLADPEIGTYLYDGVLVMGNLMNAAQAVGVDSCYIFRAKEVFETAEGHAGTLCRDRQLHPRLWRTGRKKGSRAAQGRLHRAGITPASSFSA